MNTKNQHELVNAVHETADELGCEVYKDYSGRGMYGRTCYGLASSDVSDSTIIEEAATRGLRGARVDNLGRGVIVYWPHVKGKDCDNEA